MHLFALPLTGPCPPAPRLLFTICFLLNCSFVLTCKFLNFHHSFSFFFYLIFPGHLLRHATPAKLAMAPSMTATLAALFTAFVCISKCVKCVPHCQARGGSEAGRWAWPGRLFVHVQANLLALLGSAFFLFSMHKNVNASSRANALPALPPPPSSLFTSSCPSRLPLFKFMCVLA